ncbi:hypothetical protein ABS642_00950 [Microbacterium sp. A8/3-1]|uniref:Uncharacterized protein n=1 Tax=Microbacterium sp. A8/3-1 TaxID=3160749 RepID=A0AAU7VX93_9MICO
MGAPVDHAELAAQILEVGQEVVGKIRESHEAGDLQAADDYGRKAMGCWAQAQVHATLALVEEQRVANLVALFQVPEDAAGLLSRAGVDFRHAAGAVGEALRKS